MTGVDASDGVTVDFMLLCTVAWFPVVVKAEMATLGDGGCFESLVFWGLVAVAR